MISGNMRFVLEEGNMLTLRNEDGDCIQEKDNTISEGHSLVLKSEDLSYITYGPTGFHYKRYNPESLAIEDEYSIDTGSSQSVYEDNFPLAAYCPKTKKAFFITISKTTREIWIYENGSSEPKKVNEDLPSKSFGSLSSSIYLKKDVSFHSSYLGEGQKKYSIFLSGKDSIAYWQFAIDIPKNNSDAPKFVTLGGGKVSRRTTGHPIWTGGEGINPSSISIGRGGHVGISTPVDEESMELKNDSRFLLYKLKYSLSTSIILLSLLFIFAFLMTNLLFSIFPESWIDRYLNALNYWHSIDCEDCGQVTEQGNKIITALLLGCVTLLLFLILAPLRWWERAELLSGSGVGGAGTRQSKKYNFELRKFSDLLGCHQISPSMIALLQPNKIQFYNFRTHQILEQETIHGDFKGYRWLGQNFHKSPELRSLHMYRIANDILQIKVCYLDSKSIHSTKLYIKPGDYQRKNKLLKNGSELLVPPVSLRMVMIDYHGDAFQPFELNSRVKIDHTTKPMRLIINHRGSDSGVVEFYDRLHRSPQVWSNIKQISNLTRLVGNQADGKEIIFELDDERTLVHKPGHFDHFSQVGDGSKHKQDEKLRLRRGNKEFAPNLETAIFLETFNLNSPVNVFKDTFSDRFPTLMKMLWVGEMDSKIHQGREEFNIEDDLPALSFMHNKLSKFEGCNPKQNTGLWEDWEDHLPSEKLESVLRIIEENVQWPRKGYAHQMMHGDLTPANVIVNAGDNEDGYPHYVYDLFLCDFPDVVARRKDGSTIYRTEIALDSSDSTSCVTSHFLSTQLPPKINPMLDLSRFLANLLLKIPFESSRREGRLASIKLELRNEARKSRVANSISMIRKELESALDWAQQNLRDSCFLAEEGTEDSWIDLLKAMTFDQCLQIMMFWRSYRSKSAINNDLAPRELIEAFYGEIPIKHEWNKEVVKLNLLDWKNSIDPFDTTVGAYGVSEDNLPKILDKVIEEGFPAKTFRRWPKERDSRDKGWFDFRFEEDDIIWSCMCYVEDETLMVDSIYEDSDWTDWP